MAETCKIKPWLLKKVVLPQNSDHAGVMWHGSYINWLEEARINALSSVGLSYSNLSKEGFEMPLVELNIRYLIPLFHGDHVYLRSWVHRGKGLRVIWETKFFKASIKPVALARIDLVLIEKDNSSFNLLRKTPIHIEQALRKLELGPTT